MKSSRRAGIDRARGTPRLTALELDGVPLPRRATADSDGRGESDGEVEKRYFVVG